MNGSKYQRLNKTYESLQYDPLFVKDRADFTVKQHLPFTPNGPTTWRNDGYIKTIKG